MQIRTKLFCFAATAGVALSAALSSPAWATSTTFRFVNLSGYDGIAVQYVASPLSDAVELPYENSAWEHTIEHDFADWSVEPSFVIRFRRTEQEWPIRFPAFSMAIPVQVTKLSPEKITLPVHLFNSLSSNSIERVERLTRSDQMFERRVLAEQMYRYFIGAINNPGDRTVRRIVNLWFDSSFQLTTKVASTFLPDEEAMLAAASSFSPETETGERFARLAADWKSLFWNDIRLLSQLLQDGRCDEAEALIDHVDERHAAAPELAVYRLGETAPDAFLAERRQEYLTKCASLEG